MSIPIGRIVDASVTRATRIAARRNFGLTLIAAYHTVFPERVRLYEDPADMLTDGFDDEHPAYLGAVALTAQEGRPAQFKIGRRVGAPTQTVVLTPTTPTEGEIYSIKIGGVTFSVTAPSTPTVAGIIDALVLLMTADADGVVSTPLATALTAVEYTTDDFDGVSAEAISPPRNATYTFNTDADWLAGTVIVTGLDKDGRVQTESVTIPVGGGSTVVGTKVWSAITQVNIPAMDGVAGDLTIGTGVVFANAGLAFTPTDNTTNLSIAASVAGAWYAYQDGTRNLGLRDATAQPATTLAVDLAAMRAEDPDWYALNVADAQSAAQITAIATYAEALEIVHLPDTFDSACEDNVDTDIISTNRNAARLRTFPVYSRVNPGRFPACALAGAVLGIDPGRWTAAYKTLSGVSPDTLSPDAVTRIIGSTSSPVSGKGGVIYSSVRPDGVATGQNVTLGGLGGGAEWLDIVQGIDFTQALIQERTWNILLNATKLGFTAEGIDQLEGATRGALETVSRAPYGVLVESSISIERVEVGDVATADKQNRYYDGIRWDAIVQGAIHTFRVRGTVRP